jgi:GT2 family glycosyltransferase
MKTVSLLIPNYNGAELLSRNLPPIVNELRELNKNNEIIVIDDASTDSSLDVIKNFKEVKLIVNNENSGFIKTVNRGFKLCQNELILLMNNDVEIERGFLILMIDMFEKQNDLFAVSPSIITSKEKMLNEALTYAKFENELIYTYQPYLYEISVKLSQPREIFYAVGACSLYNREKFIELNGFNEAYLPFFWEDVDICYRAWLMNWKSLIVPDSVVYHTPSRTIKRYYDEITINSIMRRNQILFNFLYNSNSRNLSSIISKLISLNIESKNQNKKIWQISTITAFEKIIDNSENFHFKDDVNNKAILKDVIWEI